MEPSAGHTLGGLEPSTMPAFLTEHQLEIYAEAFNDQGVMTTWTS